MTPLAIGTMIVICTVVWGGLAALIAIAAVAESRKRRDDADAP